MQREMLSHFIILNNKMSTRGDQTDGTSTCTRQVKKYSQIDKNGLSAWMLLLCCCCQKTNDDLWLLLSEKAETLDSVSTQETQKTQKAFLEWPTPEKHPLRVLRSSSMPCATTEENYSKLFLKHCLKPCQKSSNETRVGPLLNHPA